MYFFFFQAEDGIRDKLVTGVQTCALPISSVLGDRVATAAPDDVFGLDQDERKRRPRWLTLALPVGAGLIVLALLGWLVGTALGGLPSLGNDNGTAAAGTPTSKPVTEPPLAVVKPTDSRLYDPEGDGKEAA